MFKYDFSDSLKILEFCFLWVLIKILLSKLLICFMIFCLNDIIYDLQQERRFGTILLKRGHWREFATPTHEAGLPKIHPLQISY